MLRTTVSIFIHNCYQILAYSCCLTTQNGAEELTVTAVAFWPILILHLSVPEIPPKNVLANMSSSAKAFHQNMSNDQMAEPMITNTRWPQQKRKRAGEMFARETSDVEEASSQFSNESAGLEIGEKDHQILSEQRQTSDPRRKRICPGHSNSELEAESEEVSADFILQRHQRRSVAGSQVISLDPSSSDTSRNPVSPRDPKRDLRYDIPRNRVSNQNSQAEAIATERISRKTEAAAASSQQVQSDAEEDRAQSHTVQPNSPGGEPQRTFTTRSSPSDKVLAMYMIEMDDDSDPVYDADFQAVTNAKMAKGRPDCRYLTPHGRPSDAVDRAHVRRLVELTCIDFCNRIGQVVPADLLAEYHNESYESQYRRIQSEFNRRWRGVPPAPSLWKMRSWEGGFDKWTVPRRDEEGQALLETMTSWEKTAESEDLL